MSSTLDEIRRCVVDNAPASMFPPQLLAKALLELDERVKSLEVRGIFDWQLSDDDMRQAEAMVREGMNEMAKLRQSAKETP